MTNFCVHAGQVGLEIDAIKITICFVVLQVIQENFYLISCPSFVLLCFLGGFRLIWGFSLTCVPCAIERSFNAFEKASVEVEVVLLLFIAANSLRPSAEAWIISAFLYSLRLRLRYCTIPNWRDEFGEKSRHARICDNTSRPRVGGLPHLQRFTW